MKILISGDPHAELKHIEVFKSYIQLLRKYQEEADMVIILGDLFNSHAIIRSEILNIWLDYFKTTIKPHILLVGNHDQSFAGSNINALQAFKLLDKIIVIDSPQVIGRSAYIPYIHDIKQFEQCIEAMLQKNDKLDYLFCHQTFNGSQYENGFYAPDGIPIDIIQSFKQVISGHIHKQQKLGNIFYPGTPYSIDFSNNNENKALWIMDTNSTDFQAVPTNLPQYITQSFENVNFVLDWIKKQNSENKFKLVLRDSRAAIQELQNSNEFKELRSNYNIIISTQYTDVMDTITKISDSASLEEMVKKYIMEIMNTNCNRNLLLDKALFFLQKS